MIRLYAYTAIFAVSIGIFLAVAIPAHQWLSAAAELQLKNVQLRQIELDRQEMLFGREIAEQDPLPERVIIEEIVTIELEPSWISATFWNWLFPIIGSLLGILAVAWILFALYSRFGSALVGRSRTTLSIFSASLSISGMIFAGIRYQSELLEHEMGAYLLLSCLYSLIFFSFLIGARRKIVSLAIYSALLGITVLVGWFTAGSPRAIIDEYQALLVDLTIPLQTILVIGTALPILLVFSSLAMKPDQSLPS